MGAGPDLLDLMMPEMDGFAFLAELRKNPLWQQVPVVVLTAKDLTPAERDYLRGKVERVVQKGAYSREALLNEVRRIAAQCAGTPAADKTAEATGSVAPRTMPPSDASADLDLPSGS
jgi:DNA-binding response OmpR family regulator